jgi:hypothetical protein
MPGPKTSFSATDCQTLLDLMAEIIDGIDLPGPLESYAENDEQRRVLVRLRDGAHIPPEEREAYAENEAYRFPKPKPE